MLYEEQIYLSDTFFLVNGKILLKFFQSSHYHGSMFDPGYNHQVHTHLQYDMTARIQSAFIPTQLGDVLWCYSRESSIPHSTLKYIVESQIRGTQDRSHLIHITPLLIIWMTEKMLKADHIKVCTNLKGQLKDDGIRLFAEASSDKIRGMSRN